jgi:glycosyltransferase involved in cell wall biosynthesis
LNILILISEAPPIKSGVARVAEQLCLGLKAYGYQVDLLSANEIPRFERGEFRLSSMPVELLRLRRQLLKYDLIHLHGPVPTFSDVFLLLGLKILGANRPRLVFTYHAPIEFKSTILSPMLWSYNRLQERIARQADHVVVTTASYANRLVKNVPAEKLSVIPWGVDFERYAAPVEKKDPFTIVYLGQIRPYKGLPILLKAFSGLSNMRLWVIGDGHYRRACQKMAETNHLPEVRFWGALPDCQMIQLLQQAHVIVLPSVTSSESFGIVLSRDGSRAGSNCLHLPGVADVIGNEGFTFKPGDYEALRAILNRLRDDSALRSHLATLAQAKARLYPWSRVIFGYDRIYRQLLHSLVSRPVFSIDIPTRPVFKNLTD